MLLSLPMVLSAGGMAGAQTSAITIRGLAVREILESDFMKLMGRELLIGSILGLMLGLVAFGFAHYVEGLELTFAMMLAALVLATVLLGIFLGALLPFIMRRFRWDPVIASAPVIATVVDILGLLLLMFLTHYWVRDLVPGSR
jgi:magnesium transporter